jgi:hypothetical protein
MFLFVKREVYAIFKEQPLHIEALKSAKGEDFQALQTGMDQKLADLDQSYDKALASFAG